MPRYTHDYTVPQKHAEKLHEFWSNIKRRKHLDVFFKDQLRRFSFTRMVKIKFCITHFSFLMTSGRVLSYATWDLFWFRFVFILAPGWRMGLEEFFLFWVKGWRWNGDTPNNYYVMITRDRDWNIWNKTSHRIVCQVFRKKSKSRLFVC